MNSRSERFKKRQLTRKNYSNKSHIKEMATSDLAKQLLSEEVDHRFIEEFFKTERPVYDLEVSGSEVTKSLELLDEKFSKDKYDILFESSKEVLIDQLLSPLKLSRSDLSDLDREFIYDRDNYTKSPKSVGGEGDSFRTQREKLKKESMTHDGKIQDTYTGEFHHASEMDLDHIKSLNNFHDSGGFMLSDSEKRQFAADSDNHGFTNQAINRSKREKDLKEFSETNEKLDKRRTNAAHARAEKAAEKYVPSGKVEKTVFVAQKAAQDGIKVGANQGLQQALGKLLAELISATFAEVKDVLANGFKNGEYNIDWIEALKIRMNNVKKKLLEKWKNVASAFASGALSGFVSAIVTALLNMFVRTGKNVVRLIREGFLSLSKAIKTLILPPEGLSIKEAAHEATKVLATGVVVTGGIMTGESISAMLNGIPFADTISMVLAGMISGLGSLFVVFMLDKLDLFGVNEKERHEFIMGKLESRITLNIERSEAVIERLGLTY
ncbi:hypothetical protein [Gynuella sp.]|uniref:hypothetical protein n=1 Tax=Gynuella sp. TaxID=2969146 RepID=UPI003D12389C